MLRHGWTLLLHEGVTLQLRKLQEAATRAEQNDPQGFESNANVKLFQALSHLIMEAVPTDPGVMSSDKAIRWAPPTDIGAVQKSAGAFSCSFATTQGPRSSSMHGSTTKIPYGLQAANLIPTPYLRRCWAVATRLMTGMR
ncbi:hypothetical protein F477_04275 [Pseudomonas sp. URIL14HWK12:I3]|nr:hypothetical protein F478_04348 [Pseudomonas sp. URIL14HWK12:I2]PZW51587.1 hypothetical protein F477_04275 [Pseudomonas sp. URIL14HWK12:I3]